MDSDDLWLPDKIASQVGKMARSPEAGFCYTKCEEVDSVGLRTGLTYGRSDKGKSGDNFRRVLFRGPVVLPSVMVRRQALTVTGLFDEAIDIGEDSVLILRLALYFPAVYVPETLTLVRLHGERKTTRDRRERRHRKAGMYLFPRLLTSIPNDRPGARRLVARRLTLLTMVEAEATSANRTEFMRAVVEGYRKQLGTDDRRHLVHVTASTMVAWYSRNQRTAKVQEIVETFARIAQECEPARWDVPFIWAKAGSLHVRRGDYASTPQISSLPHPQFYPSGPQRRLPLPTPLAGGAVLPGERSAASRRAASGRGRPRLLSERKGRCQKLVEPRSRAAPLPRPSRISGSRDFPEPKRALP